MKRTTIKVLHQLIFMLLGGTAFAQVSPYASNEVILRFDAGVPPVTQAAILNSYNLVVLEGPTPVSRFLLCAIDPYFPDLPPGSYTNAVDSINGVIEIVQNLESDVDGIGLHFVTLNPSIVDERLPIGDLPPLLRECGASGFSIDVTPPGTHFVKVGVFDTGISGKPVNQAFEFYHPDLFDPFFSSTNPGVNFITTDIYPIDYNGHGTHMSSTIVVDIPASNDILELRAFQTHGPAGTGHLYDIIQAIDQGVLEDIKIVNMSFSYSAPAEHGLNPHSPLKIAIEESLSANGTLFIAAAGNNGRDNDATLGPVSFPASFPNDNIISVASIGCTKELSTFSNIGKETVDLAALGEDVPGAFVNGEIAVLSGTSPATSMVTRVAAMLANFQDVFYYKDIKCAILNGTSHSLNLVGKVASEGYLNAEAAYGVLMTGCELSGGGSNTGGGHAGNGNGGPSGGGSGGGNVHPDFRKSMTPEGGAKAFELNHSTDANGIQLQITSAKTQNAQVNICNLLGQIIHQETILLTEGNNEYYWSQPQNRLAELYLLQVQVGPERKVLKVLR